VEFEKEADSSHVLELEDLSMGANKLKISLYKSHIKPRAPITGEIIEKRENAEEPKKAKKKRKRKRRKKKKQKQFGGEHRVPREHRHQHLPKNFENKAEVLKLPYRPWPQEYQLGGRQHRLRYGQGSCFTARKSQRPQIPLSLQETLSFNKLKEKAQLFSNFKIPHKKSNCSHFLVWKGRENFLNEYDDYGNFVESRRRGNWRNSDEMGPFENREAENSIRFNWNL
jgi:hypothetical protein